MALSALQNSFGSLGSAVSLGVWKLRAMLESATSVTPVWTQQVFTYGVHSAYKHPTWEGDDCRDYHLLLQFTGHCHLSFLPSDWHGNDGDTSDTSFVRTTACQIIAAGKREKTGRLNNSTCHLAKVFGCIGRKLLHLGVIGFAFLGFSFSV